MITAIGANTSASAAKAASNPMPRSGGLSCIYLSYQ